MSSPSESQPSGLGLLLLLGVGLAFTILAPTGALTLPLAALVLLSRPGRRGYVATASVAAGISLWWLAQIGDPPDQVVRAAVVIGTATFILTLAYTSLTLTHRSLVSVALAAVGVTGFAIVLRTSWTELRWWVESRIGFAAQLTLSRLSLGTSGGEPTDGSDLMVLQLEDWIEVIVPVMADFFPATLAVQMLAGFALATVLYHRLTPEGAGPRPGRLKDFRFSEHLGWVAVAALAIVLLTRLATTKLLAANVLVVAGFLYALRGAAVAWFGITTAGGPGFFTIALMVFAVVFMLPVVLTGAILLGVVDAGLDLRQRWATPRARS